MDLGSILMASNREEDSHDCMEYAVFPDFDFLSSKTDNGGIKKKIKNELENSDESKAEKLEAELESLRIACFDIVQPYLEGYIWQKQSFNLKPFLRKNNAKEKVRAKDSMEEEGEKSDNKSKAPNIDIEFEDFDKLSDIKNTKTGVFNEIVKQKSEEIGGWREVDDWEEENILSGKPFLSKNLGKHVTNVPHLYGSTRFGDNIEDEWFITWMLFEISKKLPYVSIAVRDSDGQFLLIEAAFAIPKWLKPGTSTNRVFIRQGTVRIIPLSLPPSKLSSTPAQLSLAESLQILHMEQVKTVATDGVQTMIKRRIGGYPELAGHNMHTARCRVPIRVAQVLRHEPQIVGPAVDAFYSRDVDDMKVASKMEKFFPTLSKHSLSSLSKEKQSREKNIMSEESQEKDGGIMVDVMVRFNRAMYAQLSQQTFHPPKGYPMPFPSDKHFKAAELGMKLSCGFEMLYANKAKYEGERSLESSEKLDEGGNGERGNEEGSQNVEGESGRTGGSEEQREGMEDRRDKVKFRVPIGDPGWEKFRKSLENMGYFQGLLEGSAKHRELLQKALEKYRKTETYSLVIKTMLEPVNRINEILAKPVSVEDFPASNLRSSDDDGWLYTGEEDLSKEITDRQIEMEEYESRKQAKKKGKKTNASDVAAVNFGTTTSKGGGQGTVRENVEEREEEEEEEEDDEKFNPLKVVESMQAFVDKLSSFEGAEVPGIDDEKEGGGRSRKPVSLDVKRFMRHLEKAVGMGKNLDSEFSDTDSDEDWDMSDNEEEDEDREEVMERFSREGTSFPYFSQSRDSLDTLHHSSKLRVKGGNKKTNAFNELVKLTEGESNKTGRGTRSGVTIMEVPETSGRVPKEKEKIAFAKIHEGKGKNVAVDKRRDSDGKEEWEEREEREEREEESFMEAYTEAMETELDGSTLIQSFERANLEESSGHEKRNSKETNKGNQTKKGKLRPIDVDVNLVESLLESYSSQQGLPGPASNLIQAMGLQFPNTKEKVSQRVNGKETESQRVNTREKESQRGNAIGRESQRVKVEAGQEAGIGGKGRSVRVELEKTTTLKNSTRDRVKREQKVAVGQEKTKVETKTETSIPRQQKMGLKKGFFL